ncbi:unnamed protein product, partial [Vitis vinifera]|uniref:Uncharacterized protein n=1 Tax=Vitis vinifera TaxID=29760 RepID=D7U7G2_VITVI
MDDPKPSMNGVHAMTILTVHISKPTEVVFPSPCLTELVISHFCTYLFVAILMCKQCAENCS